MKKPYTIKNRRIVITKPDKIMWGKDNIIEVGKCYKRHGSGNWIRLVENIGLDGTIWRSDNFGKMPCSYKHFAQVCDIKNPLD